MNRESKVQKLIMLAWMNGIVFKAGTYLTFVEWIATPPDNELLAEFEKLGN